MSTGSSFFVVITICVLSQCYCSSMPSPEAPQNDKTQALLKDNMDISLSQKPGGRPVVSSSHSSSNMLWQSSDNATALYLHTNSSPAGGWGGMLELKRPTGGGTLGIKRPPEGGRPVMTLTGAVPLYESNGTSVGLNGMIDSAGNREGHMSIKRP